MEGKEGGKWILIDLGDVIVHVFQSSERAFYNLENYGQMPQWLI